MTKLRDDLRTAFEREQMALGDVGDARHRLVQGALAAREPAGHRVQWAAGIAAVLIAALVIATFAFVRGNIRPHALPATTPKANASPTPLQNAIDVLDSTPLILYQDPAKFEQLDGVTWDGKSSGKLADQQLVGVGNPQNNLFGSADSITDRSGNPVMTGPFGVKFWQATWADDGTHFCYMTPFSTADSAPTTLVLGGRGQAPSAVARVGTLYNQTSVRVAACSVLSDRAVVVQSGGQGIGTAQVWVVELSTGRVVWARAYDVAATNVNIVASRDAAYVAENRDQGGRSAGSIVYGPDGKPAANLTSWVEAFSWDGSLAVVDDGYGFTPVDLVAWRDGTVLWASPPGFALERATGEPNGTRMAIWVAPANEFRSQSITPDLYVIGPTGAVIFRIAAPVLP